MKKKCRIPNKIIVLGGNHHNALGIIRSLGEVGCNVFYIALGTKKNFVVKSKYIKNYWFADSEKRMLNILKRQFSNVKCKPILIPSDDYTVAIVDKNLNILKEKFIAPNINNQDNAVVEYMNKKVMTKLAEKHGFLVPKTCIIELSNLEDILLQMNEFDIKYPCIIKPLQSIDGSKSDITICKNDQEFLANIDEIKNKYKNVIVQEYIRKEGEIGIQGIATINAQEIIIPGIINKNRESSTSLGSTTYAKIVKSNTSIDFVKTKSLIRDLIYELNFKGIFDIELMYSEEKLYFIELNFRNGAYGYALTRAGINIPELWCLDAINIDLSNESTRINKEITLMSEFADFKNVISSKVSLFRWLIQFITTNAYLTFNLKDIKPFIYRMIYSFNY